MDAPDKFAVVLTKPSGVDIVFTLRPREQDAAALAARLTTLGMPAHVEHARPGDIAGASRG